MKRKDDVQRRDAGHRFDGWLLAATITGGVAAAMLWAPPQLLAQWPWEQQRRVDDRLVKDSAALRTLADEADGAVEASVIELFVPDEADGGMVRAALGLVVSEDGFVLTKASELTPNFVAEIPVRDGQTLSLDGRIVGVARDHDLAAIKLTLPPGLSLTPASFDASAVRDLEAGSWLISSATEPDDGPLAVGNVSITGVRKVEPSALQLGISMGTFGGQSGIPIARVERGGDAARAGLRPGDLIVARDGQAVGTRQAFLQSLRYDRPGAVIALDVLRDNERLRIPVRLSRFGLGLSISGEVAGVPVVAVLPGGSAEEAGVRVNDLITSVGGTAVRDGQSLRAELAEYKSGDRLTLDIVRNGRERALDVRLGDSGRSPRARLQNRLGGTTLSRRGADFPAVIQHDSILGADEMGGPVVDLRGRVVGMNIARAGRVETYALPAQVIVEVLPDLLAGRFPPALGPTRTEEGLPPPQQPLSED